MASVSPIENHSPRHRSTRSFVDKVSIVKTSNQILGELIQPKDDSWLKIFADAIACTVLFALATTVAGMGMYVVAPIVSPRLAIVYLPVWSFCMLSVAFYARWRERLLFSIADLAWAIPVLVALSVAIDILGHSSFWVFIIAYATYIGTCYLGSLFRIRSEKRDEQRHPPKSPTVV